jgi:DNA primase catalytic core
VERYDVSDVIQKAPLVEVATRLGIEVERRGAQIVAICPFHKDSKPSLNLYSADGTSPAHYHCFACGAHGTGIDLVKKIQGLDFLPAVSWLAHQFNIKPPRGKLAITGKRKILTETALEFALRTFKENNDDDRFKKWCAEREFNYEFIKDYGVRCIPRGVLINSLQTKPIGERIELIDGLEKLGLIKRLRKQSASEQLKLELPEQFRDYFHDGRIIIPIYDSNSKQRQVVGFAGRALQNNPPEGIAKYLLTPGFDKSSHLFNAANSFQAIEERLKQNLSAKLYLVEGFFDALRLYSLGHSAVALMGVSLSDGQLDLLKGLAENTSSTGELTYSVFLDSDSAGFGGATRLVRRLLDLQGVNLRWIGLPWRTNPGIGKDPDTFLQGIRSPEDALAKLSEHEMPAEGAILASELGSVDSSELQKHSWEQLSSTVRERALYRTAMAVKRLYGLRPSSFQKTRLNDDLWRWAQQLAEISYAPINQTPKVARGLYLEESLPRTALARRLAYHGSRRGELPCDEAAWQVLNSNEFLFDSTVLERLKATINDHSWHQAAPFDAVYLPRKLTADENVLDDPRLKVMPHPADLHVQQLFLNEILTQRHDRLSASGQAFSARIPAVRWYESRKETVVTGAFVDLNSPDLELGEPKTLSFGYQIDMDVLEGDRTPSDQGMFRPFGQCWRDFMACLDQQCHLIGPRVHVLRLDAKRYYDSIQRYVVREQLINPLCDAIRDHNPEGFDKMFGLNADSSKLDSTLERLLYGLIFGHEYHDPSVEGKTRHSEEVSGIPQGPVLSAYIGTIALFPVDDAARKFIRRTSAEETGPDGNRRPRVGYARYVDDVVLFAENETLLAELREILQTKAAEYSISLVHKGESVRSGTPSQVMRQLNDGRGLAASVPAWDALIVGDGESDWGLGSDLPKVDRQCALQVLRHPSLIDRPEDIINQVKAATSAPDLRSNDLGLCARWIWWNVATIHKPADSATAWVSYWNLWNEICEGHDWPKPFKERGYDILFAVEGLDKLLDPNPWQSNGQILSEREKSKKDRTDFAQTVCQPDFFDYVQPKINSDHIKRRQRLVVRKAWRLVGGDNALRAVAPQGNRQITAIEWLCLAGQELTQETENNPLVALRGRIPVKHAGSEQAFEVVEQLKSKGEETDSSDAIGLAIDFIVRSARPTKQLRILSKFPRLLTSIGNNNERRLISHLPILNHNLTSLYEIDNENGMDGRQLYRCVLASENESDANYESRFVNIQFHTGHEYQAQENQVEFNHLETSANTISCSRSAKPLNWFDLRDLTDLETSGQETRTSLAASLFTALLSMHRLQLRDEERTYVPFLPQLFQENNGTHTTLHLLADPVRRSDLGVSAWYHDRDGHVQSENVPFAGADIWRVGWAVADLFGIAADIAGETGERNEIPRENVDTDDESYIKHELENYVLRQQLRKLQGSYLSSANVDGLGDAPNALPKTVDRALNLLKNFPARENLSAQVRHVILMEAESRAMATRMKLRIGGDLRHDLHLIFPEVLARLPLWALAGLKLSTSNAQTEVLRPDTALLLSLYRTLFPVNNDNKADSYLPSLQMALGLSTVGMGLRGIVAALWGHTAERGSQRVSENFNLPADWKMPNMARLDPEGDYRAIRKSLLDGDWPELCKASPWRWMLALIGMLDANFAQIFNLEALKELFVLLGHWQTASAQTETDDSQAEPWPFETLPLFTSEQSNRLMQLVPEVLCSLDDMLGMKVVSVRGKTFGRSRDTDEFTDAIGASWQMSKPQYTGLYTNSIEENRPNSGGRVYRVWTETRRISDDSLIAVHTLDIKLGKWCPTQFEDIDSPKNEESKITANLPQVVGTELISVTSQVDEPISDSQLSMANNIEIENGDLATSETERTAIENLDENANQNSDHQDTTLPPKEILSKIALQDFFESQTNSWKNRLGGSTSFEITSRVSSHFRVALFQFRVDESYSHPLAEVGINGLPLIESAKNTLKNHLKNGSLKKVNKAVQRGSEYQWDESVKLISWPEHRRRVLLTEALEACHSLNVELLVLPEVSVRPETVDWLKKQLLRYPKLAILAGTYREFSENESRHLAEQLTLLWQPPKETSKALGFNEDMGVISFERGKKYRAVAAHELFRPNTEILSPLYTEAKLMQKLNELRRRLKIGEWTSGELDVLVQFMVHGRHKLRYCTELICSELFLLTSPANRLPLVHELTNLLRMFGMVPNDVVEVGKLVDGDIKALGDLLTFAQENRERRSVLLIPACTSRSNDYWHAGQASVLASGTASVFCNAAKHKGSIGGSCFIGADSVTKVGESAGIVRLLTPYHGWSKGILQPDCKGSLSEDDQALVVVDIDPVNVVSGKPRPQLLPEPMSLVAYLPIVEVINKEQNSTHLAKVLDDEMTSEEKKKLSDVLKNLEFRGKNGKVLMHKYNAFEEALHKLLEDKNANKLNADSETKSLDEFKDFFGDPKSVRERILAWAKDRHQQPASKAGALQLEPAWLDFLVADLTWKDETDYPKIHVLKWNVNDKEDL